MKDMHLYGRKSISNLLAIMSKTEWDKRLLSEEAWSFTLAPNVLTWVKLRIQIADLLLQLVDGPR